MYCRKCGKQIDYDAPICNECRTAENVFDALSNNGFSQPIGDRKEGFGRSLTSTIIGGITFFLSLISMAIISVALQEITYGYYSGGSIVISIFLSVSCLGGAIPAMIFGIKSIRCFIVAKNDGRIKPIATLVCGIVGLVLSALTMFYVLLTFLMCALI